MEKTLENIRRIRTRLGYSQDDIADLMGIERSTYSNFETGKTNLFCKNLSRFAEVVGMTEEEIVSGESKSKTYGYLQEGNVIDRLDALEAKIDGLTSMLEKYFGKKGKQ